ncbi:Septin-domain-containing protein [Multifurca ochricompacta]|uniref:Septin-domain-containing protein n=1 Tax=Multifurca ochricompacta TaxID=376703 RepID=A0AAD4M761_9AGAM|nr:Septin-domain-containing protein [Multifurca ochricompacta]
MFRSFRKKSVREPVQTPIRKTSLPDITSQDVQWPEEFVDVAAIRHTPPPEPRLQGAAPISFQTDERDTTPFHKPFRRFPRRSHDGADRSISSIYLSHPPSAFHTLSGATTRVSQRRTRAPPKLNLMVAGARGTGKTSLLRLLLDTADISSAATVEQRASFDRFMRGGVKATPRIHSTTIDILESRFDRVLLSVIDTPGLDFQEGRELKLERQVSNIMKYLDGLYADTMSEESKVVRQSKDDEHVHLCIYLIDPSSIKTSTARRHLISYKTPSKATISLQHPDETPPLTDDDGDSDIESDSCSGSLTMSPAEIRVIRRLAGRVNVLPVIGRSDSLTDDKLRAVKATVKRELYEADLGFGVFAPDSMKSSEASGDKDNSTGDGNITPIVNERGDISSAVIETNSESDNEDGTHTSRPVIRLRTGRQTRPPRRSRSRSRLELAEEAREPQSPDPLDSESIANVRFSAPTVARSDLSPLLPFAIIAPEKYRWHRLKPAAEASGKDAGSDAVHAPMSNSDSPITPVWKGPPLSQATSPPDDLKGVFVRRFRWGTVDVLDPTHCDFAALRTAVLSTYMKVLKTHTREVLYENFRTEKLLARRATRTIGEEQTKKLIQGVFVSHSLIEFYLALNLTLALNFFRSRVVKSPINMSGYRCHTFRLLCSLWIPTDSLSPFPRLLFVLYPITFPLAYLLSLLFPLSILNLLPATNSATTVTLVSVFTCLYL